MSIKNIFHKSLHKICENTGFHWPAFSRIRWVSILCSEYFQFIPSSSIYLFTNDLTSYRKNWKLLKLCFFNHFISIKGYGKLIVPVLIFMLAVQFFSREGRPVILVYINPRMKESDDNSVYVLSIVIFNLSLTELERKVISSLLSISG